MKYLRFAIVCLISLSSCDIKEDTKASIKLSNAEKRNQVIIDSLGSEYGVTTRLDTLKFVYSFQYQEITKDKVLIVSPKIVDCYTTDSTTYVKVKSGVYPAFILNLTVSDSSKREFLYNYLRQNSTRYPRPSKTVFVVSLESVTKPILEIKAVTDYENGDEFRDEVDAYIDLEEAWEIFIGIGKVIDVQQLE